MVRFLFVLLLATSAIGNNKSYVSGEVVWLTVAELKDNSGLVVEVDSVDVSQIVKWQDGKLSYLLGEDLQPGEHNLVVYQSSHSGELKQLKSVSFDVRKPEGFQDYKFNINGSYEYTKRTSIDPISELTNTNDVDHDLSFNALVETKYKGWMVNGEADFSYVDDLDRSSTDNKFDMGSYNLSFDKDGSKFRVGQHQPIEKSILTEEFDKRGVSFGYKKTSNPINATVFSMRSTDVIGKKELLQLKDNDRVDGYSIQLSPLGDREKILLTYASISGKQTEKNWLNEDVTKEGSGESVAVIGNSLDGRAQWQVEKAWTRFDEDESGSDYSEQEGDGVFVSLSYEPETDYEDESAINWSATTDYQKVTPSFRSIANDGVGVDIEELSISVDAYKGEYGVNSSLIRSLDNIDKIADTPQVQTDSVELGISWSPEVSSAKTLFGSPSLGASAMVDKQTDAILPAGMDDFATNNKNKTLSLNADFSYDNFDWSVSHSDNWGYDYININSDTHDIDNSLSANLRLLDGFIELMPGYTTYKSEYIAP